MESCRVREKKVGGAELLAGKSEGWPQRQRHKRPKLTAASGNGFTHQILNHVCELEERVWYSRNHAKVN
jgi:hypothetical protein